MQKIKTQCTRYFRWLRSAVRELPPAHQALVVIAVILVTLRIILPVWHREDGRLLFWYPFQESSVCTERLAHCDIDRSRTAVEAGCIALFALGVVLMRSGRR